jgi:hypothetical protein
MCLASLTINDRGASSSRVEKVKKVKCFLLFFDNDLNFTDTVLMGLDYMDDAVLKGPDDITNLVDFNL